MLVWTVLCRSSSIDMDSNNVSLFNVIEQIQVPPAANGEVLPIDFEVVSFFQRDDPSEEQFSEYDLVLIDPEGTEHGTHPVRVDMTNHLRARVRNRSNLFRVTGSGIYWFEMRDEAGKAHSRTPLSVVFSEPNDEDS